VKNNIYKIINRRIGGEEMQFIAVIGFYTIWVTPIIFVVNLIGAIKAIKEGRQTEKYTIACCISLMLIVIPIYMMLMYI